MTITNPFEKLVECHDHIMSRLSLFEQSLQAIEKQRVVGFLSEKENVGVIFDFIDTNIALHTRDEEQGLFPKLQLKLKAKLPDGDGADTPVDVMEGEHRIVEEVIGRIKNLAVLIEKEAWTEEASILVEEFLEKSRWVIQAYHRHIWKENNILFPMAEQLLSAEEKTQVAKVMNDLRKPTVKS